MTDELSLIRAVCEPPEEDTPRLMYADWLDEHARDVPWDCKKRCGARHDDRCHLIGGSGRASDGRRERAEFIRVQVALAEIGDASTTQLAERGQLAEFDRLRARELKLWHCGAPGTWVDSIKPAFDCIQCIDVETISRERTHEPLLIYRRGFVSAVQVTAAAWSAYADALVWSPEQTVPCPRNACRGERVSENQWSTKKCTRCKGTGHVPRPFAATAQPIECVTLTTDPGELFRTKPFLRDPDGDGWHHPEWPGVTFALPAPSLTARTLAGHVHVTRELL